jgi:hypothetical protein
LQNALQAGDLAAARGAFAEFWQGVATQTGTDHLFLPNPQTSHALQAVGNSLNLANIPGAQRAFAMFRMDMMGAGPSNRHQQLQASRPALSIPNQLVISPKAQF